MVNVSNINAKDKLLIAKALIDIATDLYKDNTDFVLNQILKNEEMYKSEYGAFWKQVNASKTIAETIEDNKSKIAKLQKEIEILSTYEDKSAKIKEETIVLKSRHSEVADKIAIEMLQDIAEDLQSKKLQKSATKVANTNK